MSFTQTPSLLKKKEAKPTIEHVESFKLIGPETVHVNVTAEDPIPKTYFKSLRKQEEDLGKLGKQLEFLSTTKYDDKMPLTPSKIQAIYEQFPKVGSLEIKAAMDKGESANSLRDKIHILVEATRETVNYAHKVQSEMLDFKIRLLSQRSMFTNYERSSSSDVQARPRSPRPF